MSLGKADGEEAGAALGRLIVFAVALGFIGGAAVCLAVVGALQ